MLALCIICCILEGFGTGPAKYILLMIKAFPWTTIVSMNPFLSINNRKQSAFKKRNKLIK